MWRGYYIRRITQFFLIIWAAATLNFFIPRLSPGRDPIQERLTQMAAQGGTNAENIQAIVDAYKARFGLDQPLWKQYLNYIGDLSHFDLGYSMAFFPARVLDLIMAALPWTIGLLTVSVILAFLIGTLFGALAAWPRAPKFIGYMIAPLMMMSAVHPYILGLILVYLFGVILRLFPIAGSYTTGTVPHFDLGFIADVIHHSILPAISIILISIGGWALGMRGMMVTVEGEDYMTLAEANGLKGPTMFFQYAVRNAILPQITGLAIAIANIIGGSILVEVMFQYPGIGMVLNRAIGTADYFVIYGIVFMIVVTIGLATLILDLVYPLLDPRISYRRA
jgi:peptide/nickel transport system permease protein